MQKAEKPMLPLWLSIDESVSCIHVESAGYKFQHKNKNAKENTNK
jgi:hypothetical protein